MLYSGFSETVGHSFVSDGYDADQNLHINWGWDGAMNGFYALDALSGFNYDQGMVINIKPSDDDTVYSRGWNDYGYLWSIEGQATGINISTEAIKANEPFSVAAGYTTVPNDFDGKWSLGLIDTDNNIVEVAQNSVGGEAGIRLESNHILDEFGYSWTGFAPQALHNIIFTKHIDPSYRLAIVTKEDKDEQWRLVLGTIEAPSICPVAGNKPYISKLNIQYHGDTSILRDDPNLKHEILKGDWHSFTFEICGGVAYVYREGLWLTNGSDYSDLSYTIAATEDEHQIDIYCNTYDHLLERTYDLSDGVSLADLIPENEVPLIHRLTLTGNLTVTNYQYAVTKLPSLQHLDLSKARLNESDNILPADGWEYNDHTTPGLLSIKLPENLKGFDIQALGHRCLEYIDIPASVDYYGPGSLSSYAGAKLRFVRVGNREPASYEVGHNTLMDFTRNQTTLIVPVGSKEKYAGHPSWQGFKEIIESDEPANERFVNSHGAHFLLAHGFASLSTFNKDSKYGAIPECVEHDGTLYPVRYTNYMADCYVPQHLYIDRASPFDFWAHYLDSHEAYSSKLDFSYDFWQNVLYVPGAHPDKKTTLYREMWEYQIDKENHLLKILPSIPEINIDAIKINGVDVDLTPTGIYHFDSAMDLNVCVEYTLNSEYSMKTKYLPEFNKQLESIDLSFSALARQPIDFNTDVKIYSIAGMLLFEGNYSDAELNEGIYIVVTPDNRYKRLIK